MARESLALDPAASSCSEARRWLTVRLTGYPDDVVDTVVLLTSELVANGVLHAETPMELGLERDARAIRVEVSDGSVNVPVARGFGELAATGRGLTLLESLATSWGVSLSGPGKVVFFEVRLDGQVSPDLPPAPTPPPPPPPPSPQLTAGLAEVVLAGLPVAALRRAGEQYAALNREFRLILDQSPEEREAVPARLFAMGDELHGQFGDLVDPSNAELYAAIQRGDDMVDVSYWLPRQIGPAVSAYDALLDEADDFCRSGDLLTVAASEETTSLRKWFFDEIVQQLEGRPPTRCPVSPEGPA